MSYYDEKVFDNILDEVFYSAIMREIEDLRKWYFYSEKHSQVNKEYYEFMAVLSSGKLTIKQRLGVAIDLYRRFYQYMCYFYPTINQIDIDLLTDDTSSEANPQSPPKRKPGRPKGSKNKNNPKRKTRRTKGSRSKKGI